MLQPSLVEFDRDDRLHCRKRHTGVLSRELLFQTRSSATFFLGNSACGSVSYLSRHFFSSFEASISLTSWLVRISRSLNLKLRLGEISRRSAELSATSSKLEKMALQLDRLRKLNGRTGLLGNCGPSRKFDHRGLAGYSRDRI
jgi:hypothetical protein